MLESVAPDLWTASQPFKYLGLNVGTRMTVVRLNDQKLTVISPIEPTETLQNELSQLGTVAHIIAPNLYHYLYAESFKRCYPTATLWATHGLKEKKPQVPIDRVIQPDNNNREERDLEERNLWDTLEATFFSGLKTLGTSGIDDFNEWVFFHKASCTLIVTDVAFFYDNSFPFVEQLMARVLGCYETLAPSRLERIATKDKVSIRTAVEKVLSWDFDRVIVAHGRVIETGGKQAFQQGYENFLGIA
ncbi:MAG: DUF4336 domain-containing protein [Cyanobacteria bacterium J06649_4]